MVDSKQIIAITHDGLSFLDNHGNEQWIDFAECYQNYLRESLAPPVERWKQVGVRNILTPPWADGPFIEFHTDPPIRFQFETEEDFYKARKTIEAGGWSTMDLS
jgi:hypothetical protein